ncbi:hypothetical protein [Vibrio europaeus]|uniref:hypothetical protein n=1 Tax=Vibrio europaeus TaxID=300876 RepID=UPI00233F2F09|nr:hypothetical protein [Vibrio europaeus]MDC5711161.1 hypothetical protein [Vibrio europaeus]MDC5713190.1 hypothetical protein [Vibrio europaeus]
MFLLGLCSFVANSAPLLPEVDTLQVSVRTVYPPEITNVKGAVEWLLEPLEYHVITDYPAPSTAKLILSRPIPTVAKMHRTMPVTHALQLLIGQDNTIIVDKKHRLITFGRGH